MLLSRVNLRSRLVQPWPLKCSCSQWQLRKSSQISTCSGRYSSTVQSTEPKSKAPSSASPDQRRQDLAQHGWTSYPRPNGALASNAGLGSILESMEQEDLATGSIGSGPHQVTGRVSSVRASGSKLLFIDIYNSPAPRENGGEYGFPTLQVVVDKAALDDQGDSSTNPVKQFRKTVQRGDTIFVRGNSYRSTTGQLSLRATEVPKLLSPCLHQIPTEALTAESDFAQDRYVHMLMDKDWLNTIRARDTIIDAIQHFMRRRDFISVQTPILAAAAGGATARSFETTATEFVGRKLTLRIAPELWLKKLMIGGMDRVFEIGQSFRNEGLDKTHNPEFTTCEFYATNWDIEFLKSQTELMFAFVIERLLAAHIDIGKDIENLTAKEDSWVYRWPSIDFLPALNEALEIDLPDLSRDTARNEVLAIFHAKSLPIPSMPTLPRLLDKLASIYLESMCDRPTWIVNTPECLSPLAKSFYHPDLPSQKVAARAELFIQSKEVVNCYEEENSPTEQRRKFIDQQKHASLNEEVDLEAMKIDEDYLRALEWGLPPTGGWGCGIDRLCMLLLNKDKISDVLPLGNLRMVTHGAEKRKETSSEGEE